MLTRFLLGNVSEPLMFVGLALMVGCANGPAGGGRSTNGSGGGAGQSSVGAGGVIGAGGAAAGAGTAGTAGSGGRLGSGTGAGGANGAGGIGTSAFVHPGLLHTQADFDRISQKVTANASPWIDSWNLLIANSHANLAWNPNPQAVISRGNDGVHPDNSATFFNDVAAAYACALRWKISGNTAYGDKAVQIMNAWSSTLTAIFGTMGTNGDYDGILMATYQGYQFANVGEIMRTYSGWAAPDQDRFKSMMANLFYPVAVGALHIPTGSSLLVFSSWDLGCVASMIAIGVLTDDRAKFDAAIGYFKTGLGNGGIAQTVYYIHPGYLGQTQESGRDQGHNTLSIALLGSVCEMAWNQGVDLYGYDNNRFLSAAEYVAKGNLIQSGTTYYAVPFATYRNASSTDTVFATGGQGGVRPEWASIYNHYVNRKGLAAPYTQRFVALTQPEGGGGNYGPNSGGYDQLGYGTLAFTRDPIAAGAPPSGLTAIVNAGQVVLSWWGTAYATSYNVKRGTTAGGPYTTIATGVTDLLSYKDGNLLAGTYHYVVSAVTAAGETATSSEATAITAVQPHTYLPFDDASGTAATDSSSNGHAATLVNGATWALGRKGSALSLDGTNRYASLPADLMVDVGDFTVATWIFWNTARTSERIFDFGSNIDHYMELTARGPTGLVRFATTLNGASGEQVIDGAAALPTNQWVHVAVTLSGAVGTLYVNGRAVGTNGAILFPPFRLGGTDQNWIGRSQYAADPYFNGLIDDFRIYRGALSAADVATLSAN